MSYTLFDSASGQTVGRHPLGTRARVLLSSVFGPYACNDEHGSRSENPMELYHNQVTRVQGPFSLRMFHRSWGLMLIQANISAPCTVLDFPTLDRFVTELRTVSYDIIGISAIVCNQAKVRKMCELIRHFQPHAKIVIGGHVANVENLSARVDADYIVRGEGVQWFRHYLGESCEAPIRHPLITSGIHLRTMGITTTERKGDTAATVIPSVGCPLGCNFCSTSAMFGGKGKFVNFYQTGDELFDVMDKLSDAMGVRSFFVMDENFLLHKQRALRLLKLMEQNQKPWSLYVFSSAKVLQSYTIEQLVALGISWVWMGLEGEDSRYQKLRGVDTRTLIPVLQSHGIKVLGSSIIGLEEHTPENIHQAIDYAVNHRTDFHQFMLYTPIPGTPLHAELNHQGRLKGVGECDPADTHGQSVFNYRHPHLPVGSEGTYLLKAFARDFEVNGPSLARITRTLLQGWQHYKNHSDLRIRNRFTWEARELATTYTAAIAAMKRYYHSERNRLGEQLTSTLLSDLVSEFGRKARWAARLGGRYVGYKIKKEKRRLAAGWTYEPPTFYEANNAALALGRSKSRKLLPARGWISPSLLLQPT